MAAAGTWKFIYVADVQSGLTPSNAVNTNVCVHMARQIVRESPDLFLLPGDLVYGNTNVDVPTMLAEYVQWSNAFSAVYAAGIPIYPVRGNHELTGDDTNATAYLTVFGASVPNNGPAGEVGLTYSFVHNNALFICLDEYKYPHQVNQPWLDSQLASNRYAHIFVFGHEPAVQTDAPTCLAIENAKRDLFLKSITDAGCRMYLCGHDHLYNRGRLFPRSGGSIMQVVCGSGGAPFSTWSGIYGQDFHEQAMGSNCYSSTFTIGYVLITVSNFNVKLEWKRSTDLETWTTYDTYSYQVTNPAVWNQTDYDGDGKADPTFYDETTGIWRIKLSSANYYQIVTIFGGLGGPGAASVGADYDGDGKADPAVYYEQIGRWAIMLSSVNYAAVVILAQSLGGSGYGGMPADYDGDGKADPGVYQRERGDWKVFLSSANYVPVEVRELLGGTGYSAVAADYDGDGKADPAVYGNGTGDWKIKLSGSNYATVTLANFLGGSGYIPFPADYDGDGKADPAVKSTIGNEWIMMLSSDKYMPVHITLSFE